MQHSHMKRVHGVRKNTLLSQTMWICTHFTPYLHGSIKQDQPSLQPSLQTEESQPFHHVLIRWLLHVLDDLSCPPPCALEYQHILLEMWTLETLACIDFIWGAKVLGLLPYCHLCQKICNSLQPCFLYRDSLLLTPVDSSEGSLTWKKI